MNLITGTTLGSNMNSVPLVMKAVLLHILIKRVQNNVEAYLQSLLKYKIGTFQAAPGLIFWAIEKMANHKSNITMGKKPRNCKSH